MSVVAKENQTLELRPSQSHDVTPIEMLQTAIDRGIDGETLKQLMELQREWKADQAREAFVEAMNAFRAEAVKIVKTRAVSYNGEQKYKFAGLGDILATAVPRLSAHGLSHRWETKQEGSNIIVSCVVTHRLGHSERATLSATPDGSGGKNSIQAIGSAVSYLERYTFCAATGLAAQDDDGAAAGPPPETITEAQVADLEALMDEVGITGDRRTRALKAWRINSLGEILAKNYAAVVQSVEEKRK